MVKHSKIRSVPTYINMASATMLKDWYTPNISTHIENIHLKPATIFDFAIKVGTIKAEDRSFYDNLLPAAKRTAGEMSSAIMPEVLRTIIYQVPDLIDSRQGPPIYVKPDAGILKLPDSKLLTLTTTNVSPYAKYLAPGYSPNPSDRGYGLSVGAGGSMVCPFKSCESAFTDTDDLAKHILVRLKQGYPWCSVGTVEAFRLV
jgi:hypothetical protein